MREFWGVVIVLLLLSIELGIDKTTEEVRALRQDVKAKHCN